VSARERTRRTRSRTHPMRIMGGSMMKRRLARSVRRRRRGLLLRMGIDTIMVIRCAWRVVGWVEWRSCFVAVRCC